MAHATGLAIYGAASSCCAGKVQAAPVKVFVVHVYDAADKLHDYYVHETIEGAVRCAAIDVVSGRFEDAADPAFFEVELQRVLAAVFEEPGVGRRHVHCDTWRAHVDEMQVLASGATATSEINALTDDEIKRLRALCDAATPDPWTVVSSKPPNVQYLHAPGMGINPCVAKLHDCANGVDNAAFITAARAAFPALLDECERLRMVYEAAKEWRAGDSDEIDILNPEHEALLMRNNERLKDAIDTALVAEAKLVELIR